MARSARPFGSFGPFSLSPLALTICLLCSQARGQDAPIPASAASAATSKTLPAVSVTGRVAPSVSGWGDTPLSKTPVQATVLDSEQLKDKGVHRLADLMQVDPAISDAYNAEGYYDGLTVRGYVLDNQFNFLRDGLPINAQTLIPLENKSQIQVLKGTSGMQTGISAPGGLVDYIVKRPLDAPLRSIGIEWEQPGTTVGHFDLSQRFGADGVFGLRINGAAAHLDPMVRNSTGNRQLFAMAGDWRVSPDTLLEAEFEYSRRSQPSQPGFSLLGSQLPSAGDPRINLNDQPWSQPVVFDATTASLRWTQKLANGWRFVAHGATQRLLTDDRLAFPYGCSAENNYNSYCSDGTYDMYDYRSEDEHRRQDALDLSLQGKFTTGSIVHEATFGMLQVLVDDRFGNYAQNLVGVGNVQGTLFTPSNPTPTYTNTNLYQNRTELYFRDHLSLTQRLGAWLGVRQTHLHQQTELTDGTGYTPTTANFTAPFAALSYDFLPQQMVYLSWGRGVQSSSAPRLDAYTNGGQVFTALSRQTELGFKGSAEAWQWNLAVFDIQQPRTQDAGTCDGSPGSCTTELDGTQHHRGLEAQLSWQQGPWVLGGGAQLLHARIEGSADPTLNGLQPVNVPERTATLQATYQVGALPGLGVQGSLNYQGRRMVLPDNSLSLPSWTRVDAGLHYQTRLAGNTTTWRLGVKNVFDRRAWRESPYQYSHVYLYPLQPRTFWASFDVEL